MSIVSSTGTHQLLDASRVPFVSGPFVSGGTETEAHQLAGSGGGGRYTVDYELTTGTAQRLWHYRVATVTHYVERAAAGSDVARLFLVMERYPFVPGTNYINDLPEIGVFLVQPDGTLVLTLRAFQGGLRVSGTSLLTANGHRAIWTLGVGALGGPVQYLHTDLDTGTETVLTVDQIAALLQGEARCYPPDFVWDHTDPQTFYTPDSLPTLTEDDVLAAYGTLLAVDGNPSGSARMVNDAEILEPLERYQEI